MTIDYRYLRSHLQKLLDDSLSEPELTGLVQLCRSICQSHLEHSRPSVVLLAVRQGLAIVDVAYDCIAEAFARDAKGAFTQLENFAESLRGSLADLPDHEIFLAFKSFLIRIADAQLARLYAQADPAGAKIHRNIRDCLKHSTGQVQFSLDKDFRGYVLRPLQSESLDHLPPFAPDELEQGFLTNARKHHRIPELLHILHDSVTGQSQYRRSIPLVDTVQLFKHVYQEDIESMEIEQNRMSVEGLTDFEIDQIRLQVETALKEKILLTYFARGKVDRRQAEGMYSAFQDMLLDWCSSEDSQGSIYKYLHQYLPLDEKGYESEFRVKMEYLVKIAREEFAARMMRDL